MKRLNIALKTKFTIITPTLNSEKFILKNLESVHLRQGHSCEIEQIIIDGLSTDRTIEIVEEFKSQYKPKISIMSGKDKNNCDAINKGLRSLNCDYWANLNSDDEYVDNAIPVVAGEFAKDIKYNLIYGFIERIDEDERTLSFNYFPKFDLKFLIGNQLCENIYMPAVFFKKEIIHKIGLMDTTFFYAADYDYLVRVSLQYTPHLLPFVLTRYREHSGSQSTNPETQSIQKIESKRISSRYLPNFQISKLGLMRYRLLLALSQLRPKNFKFLLRRFAVRVLSK